MPMLPRISALLLVAFLAPTAAGAESWLIDSRVAYFGTLTPALADNKGTIEGSLVYDDVNPTKVKLSVTFHDLFINYPLESLQPPRKETRLTVGEASFETREADVNQGPLFTGTFLAQGKSSPATYRAILEEPVEDLGTGRISRKASFIGDSLDHPTFTATLVKQLEPGAMLQQTAGEKTSGKGPWGVLVGLTTDKTRKTYFIDASGITELGDGLAVPRRDGWWFVDTIAGDLIAKPAGKVTKKDFVPLVGDDVNCADGMTGGYALDILYAGPDLVSYEGNHWTESCAGPGSFQSNARSYTTEWLSARYDAKSETRDPTIGNALGPGAQEIFDAELKSGCSEDPCSYEDQKRLETITWGLTPLRVFTAAPQLGMEGEGDPKWPLPAKLLAGLKRPSRHFVPDLQHPLPPIDPAVKEPGDALAAVTAPDGSFELRLYESNLSVWAGSKLVGGISGQHPRLVMEEWASGAATLARWKKQAAAVLANVPRPKRD